MGVFVEAEEVDISEIAFDGFGEFILIDQVEDETQIVLDGRVLAFEEGGKYVDGISVDPGAFVLGGVAGGVANVSREAVGLGGGERGGGWVIQGGEGFSV